MYVVLCKNKGDWYSTLVRYTYLRLIAKFWAMIYRKKYDIVEIKDDEIKYIPEEIK